MIGALVPQRVRDAVDGVPGFGTLPHADKLRFFAWVIHADGKEHLKAADFTACFDVLHLSKPARLHRALEALAEQGDLLKSKDGYRLSKPVRDQLEQKHGRRQVTVEVLKELERLPSKLSVPAQREYLDEALKCFRAGAWRAAIIMAWNLAYDHLCEYVMSTRLAQINAACAGWKKAVVIKQRSDLRELGERQVIDTCRTAGITDKTQEKCLVRCLDTRNDAAHPSGAKFSQSQAESFIMDVVQNVVLALR